MQRQNVIILIYPDKEPICMGNFKKLCEEFEFPYHSIKDLELPFSLPIEEIKSTHKIPPCTIYRVPFK